MNEGLAPFPDELLTSWFARRSHTAPAHHCVEPRTIRDRNGAWRLPDILPSKAWLNSAAKTFDIAPAELAASTLPRLRPRVPIDFIAWEWAPFSVEISGLQPSPRLAKAWCSRCLAEHFAGGQPARIVQQWADAASGFCHLHHWPLADRCPFCRSAAWKFASPARGPLRLLCAECWRPLERSDPETLGAEDDYRDRWDCVIAFEDEIHKALRGATPDQFQFNFTSASQLINQVRDICYLMVHLRVGYAVTSISLNSYVCAAMRVNGSSGEFEASDALFPLAIASVQRRRCMLAATCAILDPSDDKGRLLYGAQEPPALETFLFNVDTVALDRFLATPGRWSPSFARRIMQARQKARQRSTAGKLERSLWRLQKTTTAIREEW